jgi:hypothetical protein
MFLECVFGVENMFPTCSNSRWLELEENVGEGRNCTKKNLWTLKIYKSLIFMDFKNILNKREIHKN